MPSPVKLHKGMIYNTWQQCLMWYPSISKICVESAVDLKAPAHLPQGILISILTLQADISLQQWITAASFTTSKRQSLTFLPVFSIYLCEGWKEKALLRRNSRTTLCRSITPPDRKHSEEFVHELMQQHISSVCNTTLRENNLKCYPPKNIIHAQFRDKDRFVWRLNGSSGWESESYWH